MKCLCFRRNLAVFVHSIKNQNGEDDEPSSMMGVRYQVLIVSFVLNKYKQYIFNWQEFARVK